MFQTSDLMYMLLGMGAVVCIGIGVAAFFASMWRLREKRDGKR